MKKDTFLSPENDRNYDNSFREMMKKNKKKKI